MGNLVTAPEPEKAAALKNKVEEYCDLGAEAIVDADVFFLATGAGWSADSGLAVYRDVAEIEAYRARGLEYHDLCRPSWLKDEPPLFWGFFGQCFEDYRRTRPHRGYEIIQRWRDLFFRETPTAKRIRELFQVTKPGDRGDPIQGESLDESRYEAYEVHEKPGAFFCFTSNVDAHSFDHFHPAEVRECHGNLETYQCARPCSRYLWRAPRNLRFSKLRGFSIDDSSFLSDPGISSSSSSSEEEEQQPPKKKKKNKPKTDPTPRVGQVNGDDRDPSFCLRHLPPPPESFPSAGPGLYPVCPRCQGPARPAILMFGDSDWLDSAAQCRRYDAWQRAVEALAKERPLKLVILEIGAGDNVPTVRRETEHLFEDADLQTTLIRVNPEFPLADSDPLDHRNFSFLPIMTTGLAAVDAINASILRRLKSRGGAASSSDLSPLN